MMIAVVQRWMPSWRQRWMQRWRKRWLMHRFGGQDEVGFVSPDIGQFSSSRTSDTFAPFTASTAPASSPFLPQAAAKISTSGPGPTQEIPAVKHESQEVKQEIQDLVQLSAYDKERQRPWDEDEYRILVHRYLGPNFVRFPKTNQGYRKLVAIHTYFPNLDECPLVPLWDQVQRDGSSGSGKCAPKSRILALLRQIQYYEVHGAIRGEGLPWVMAIDVDEADGDVMEVVWVPHDHGWVDIDKAEDDGLHAMAPPEGSQVKQESQ
jgi:hypothetical protein